MGGLVGTLILYGGGALLFIGMITAYNVHHEKIGADKQKVADQKALNACTTVRDKAVADNKTLQDQVDTMSEQARRQNKAVDGYSKASKAALADAEKRLAEAQEQLKKYSTLNYDLLFRINQPDQGGTCEDKLKRIDTDLRTLGTQRVRDHPGSKDGGGSACPGAGENSGPGTLRIGK